MNRYFIYTVLGLYVLLIFTLWSDLLRPWVPYVFLVMGLVFLVGALLISKLKFLGLTTLCLGLWFYDAVLYVVNRVHAYGLDFSASEYFMAYFLLFLLWIKRCGEMLDAKYKTGNEELVAEQ